MLQEPLRLTVQVNGITDWKEPFAQRLAQQAAGKDLIVQPKRIPGAAGSTREDQLLIKENTKALRNNTVAAYVAAIVTAATLVLAPAGGANVDTVTCKIAGQNGVSELVISSTDPIANDAIQACLQNVGNPQRIEFTVNPRDKTDSVE